MQTPKWKALQKLILSYFHNIIHILAQITNSTLLGMAISESAKLVPYVVGSRKAVKEYLKVRYIYPVCQQTADVTFARCASASGQAARML